MVDHYFVCEIHVMWYLGMMKNTHWCKYEEPAHKNTTTKAQRFCNMCDHVCNKGEMVKIGPESEIIYE
jgi:hypothetical protein